MLSGASSFVKDVDFVFLFILAISLVLLILVTGLMVVFAVKYNRRKNPKPRNIEGNVPLEIAWTVIPTLLVLGMFYYGWVGYVKMATVPEGAMIVEVTARMWAWEFRYPNGVQTDQLYVPVHQAVRINLSSADVNHSFFIPAFRLKKDVIPNRENFAWFVAEEAGAYDIACAEYCGLQHSQMYSKVVAMPAAEFNEWYAREFRKLSEDAK